MDRLIEFVGNHPILFAALALVVGMIVFFEYQRAFSGVKIISPMEATRLQNDEEAVFLDIREDSEYKVGHIMGNLHIPMSNFPKRMVELDKYKDKPVIVYCTSGARSAGAAGKLRKADFSSVYTLQGGAAAWEKAGLPLSSKS